MSMIYNGVDLSTLTKVPMLVWIPDEIKHSEELSYLDRLHNIASISIDEFERSIIEEAGTNDANEYIQSKDIDWIKNKSKYIIDHMKANPVIRKRWEIVFFTRTTIEYSVFIDAIFNIADVDKESICTYIRCLYQKSFSNDKHYNYLIRIYDIIEYCLSRGYVMKYNEVIYRLCNIYSLGHYRWYHSVNSRCKCKNSNDAPCHIIIYNILNLCRSYAIYNDKDRFTVKPCDFGQTKYNKYKRKQYIKSLINEYGHTEFIKNVSDIISQPRTVTIKLTTPVKLKVLRGHMQRGCLINKLPKDVLNLIFIEAETIRNYDKNKYESRIKPNLNENQSVAKYASRKRKNF